MGDSNSRHLAPKASALPTALIPDFWVFSFAPDVVKHVVKRIFLPPLLVREVPVSQAYQGIAGIVFSNLKGEYPAPKPGAIPTSLYPDKDMPPASGRHIYYTSFFPRLQGKNLSWCLLYSRAFPPRRITAPAPPSGRPPDRSFPRPRPGPPGPYGRRPPAYDRWAFADPDRG